MYDAVRVSLNKRRGIINCRLGKKCHPKNCPMTLPSSQEKSDFTGRKYFFHANSHCHGRNHFRGTAGTIYALHHNGIIAERNDSGCGLSHLLDTYAEPAGNWRIIESDVAVVADAAIASVYSACRLHLL